MDILKSANRGLRFLLELAALAAFGYFGYTRTDTPLRWLLLIVLPAAAALAWGMLVAPRARVHLARPIQHVIGTAILLLATAALAATDSPRSPLPWPRSSF
jgi:hypothetical protein